MADPITLAKWLIATALMVDLVFATVGYLFTFKPLDSHIRSADPYVAGWVAALLCYPPFGGLFDYTVDNGGVDGWSAGLQSNSLFAMLMSAWLVGLAAFYAWSTVAFGFRFSNLTNRGIITSSPYAWTEASCLSVEVAAVVDRGAASDTADAMEAVEHGAFSA